MLIKFQRGEDIERIFNRLRPKYPIHKYVDVVGYNNGMRQYERNIINRFKKIDTTSKHHAIESFKKLWNSEREYIKHVEKRLTERAIKSEEEYLHKTINCLANAKEYVVAEYKHSCNRIRYASSGDWALVFNEYGKILTSHRLDETRKPFDVKHKVLGATIRRGKSDEKFREFFREL